jgi:N-acetyl-gamma-glutamyl-phosphate reductase
MLKIGIVGASGYTGAELVRLLAQHPKAQVTALTSETYAGKRLAEIYPALAAAGDRELTKLAQTELNSKNVDLVFLALPHGESMSLAPGLLEAGVKGLDLSGDFRFPDTSVYENWYQRKHVAPEIAARAVYGLPELFRKEIKDADLIANPGCYVTSAVLALYPLLESGWVESRSIIIDAKSGLSGAGRKAGSETMFTRVSENVMPYKMAGVHQHTPEIEQALSRATGQEVRVTLSPQMVPARRGILSTVYARLNRQAATGELIELFRSRYSQEPFIRVKDQAQPWPDLAAAVGSNNCILGVAADARIGLAVAAGSIDNLVKGASGQAIQNMNILFGWDETMGLPQSGLIP